MNLDDWTRLETIAGRFAGLDVAYRRVTPSDWQGPWRIRVLASKNERADYRVTAYGVTVDEAVAKALRLVAEVDAEL